MNGIACVAVVKNEERHIAEWIAYQFALGFDAVILMDNVSTDGTAAVARKFEYLYDLRVVTAPDTSRDYQKSAYFEAIKRFGHEFEWMAFFDADEFLVLEGNDSLYDLLAVNAASDAIGVNWALFGSSGHEAAPAGLNIENFQRRSGPDFGPNRHIKSIVRPSRVKGYFNSHMFKTDTPYRDLAGREIAFKSPGVIANMPDYRAGKLHHYFTLSREEWVAKLRRGYPDLERKMNEFEIYDRNDVLDDSAAKLAPRVKEIIATMSSKAAPKCGVVLVVKNEIHDIAAWLAWYHVIGFDTCIVFDDFSTDGTWEFLRQAALSQDIRLSHTKGSLELPYQNRQRESYKFAIQKYADEFDWLAFLDADELLLLQQDDNVKSFLARFPDADAVAVNWCNYGSSGHLLKPDIMLFEAFTWHGNERQKVNRHVKSIVNPKKVGDRQINVHCFDVDPERYFFANGTKAKWSSTLGIIEDEPDWRVAKIMHYQCRSMEHFIERMKKRPKLATVPAIWEAYDIKQVQDLSPLRYVEKVKAQIAVIAGQKIVPAPEQPVATEKLREQNIAFGKPATQSSVSEWSLYPTPEQDAGGAVNGRVDGKRKFHTANEENPWWQVDLGEASVISEIRIYNTIEPNVRDRFKKFKIFIGFDLDSLVEVFCKDDELPVNGMDSRPLIWKPASSAWGRFVRITLLGTGFLHLDQVEVYGRLPG